MAHDYSSNAINESNRALSDIIEYPMVLINGIETSDELIYINSIDTNINDSIPLYFEFNGAVKRIGNLELSLQYFLELLEIGKYEFYVYHDENNSNKISLETPEDLEKFIKL